MWNKDNYAYDENTGVYKLTADGCFNRHKIDREDMYNTKKENIIRNFECNNYAEREERKYQNMLCRGFRPYDNEPIEEFIARCEEQDN